MGTSEREVVKTEDDRHALPAARGQHRWREQRVQIVCVDKVWVKRMQFFRDVLPCGPTVDPAEERVRPGRQTPLDLFARPHDEPRLYATALTDRFDPLDHLLFATLVAPVIIVELQDSHASLYPQRYSAFVLFVRLLVP
jgi:hypothetical protein